ncbi:hypothetical protein [Streptomyces mirabilis]|uniref:hypothetical protein n=1 Tax=Streptomyces mirabilis TaxID=68239 RepID=UPI0033B17BC5
MCSTGRWTPGSASPLTWTNSEIVCAGGHWSTPLTKLLKSTYLYQPAAETWPQTADMPYTDFGMASSGANGKLQIVGGSSRNAAGLTAPTNQAQAYDPVANV